MQVEGGYSGVALPISAVAARLKVSQARLRMWEQRYGLAPARATAGGHRRYSPADVERLAAMVRLVERGVPTGEAARSVLAAAGYDVPLPEGADPTALRVCAAALDLDGPAVRALLREHLAATDVRRTWETVVRPVLGPIGDRWAELPHGIAVEHLLSHIAAGVIGEAAPAPAAPPRSRVLLASVPDDQHDLPLVPLAAALELDGMQCTLLGAAVPTDALVEAADRLRPDVVVLYAHLPDLADPALFERIGPGSAPIAAGPGWDPARLPAVVAHVDDLSAAVAAVTARTP